MNLTPQPMAHCSDRPLFVTGINKSGTTLVGNLVNNHPDFEINFDNEAVLQFLTYARRLLGNYFFRHADVNVSPSSNEETTPVLDSPIVRLRNNDNQLFHEMSAQYFTMLHMNLEGGLRWGSSTPMQSAFSDLIWRWYPKAEFLLVRRDPRDVWASFKTLYDPSTHNEPVAHWRRFVVKMKSVFQHIEQLRTDSRVHVVEYHEVVQRPSIVYKTLGISTPDDYLYNTDTVLYQRSNGMRRDDFVAAKRNKVITTRVGRWRRDLTPLEIAQCFKEFPEMCDYYDEASP